MAQGLAVLRSAIEERRGVRPAGTSDWLVWDDASHNFVTRNGNLGAQVNDVFTADWEIGPVVPRRFGKVPVLKILRECLGTSLSEGKTVVDRMEQEWPGIFTAGVERAEDRPTVDEMKAYWQTVTAQRASYVARHVDPEAAFLVIDQLAIRWPGLFRPES